MYVLKTKLNIPRDGKSDRFHDPKTTPLGHDPLDRELLSSDNAKSNQYAKSIDILKRKPYIPRDGKVGSLPRPQNDPFGSRPTR